MASAPIQSLPLLYNNIMPLSSNVHSTWRLHAPDGAQFLRSVHAVPLLADEIVAAHWHYPIVFASGPESVPLALMGLNEGVNTFVDEKGMFPDNVYVPAYVRRYPFVLARLRPDSEDLSLCFDPTSGMIGAFDDGEPLFEGDQASERTKGILDFCQSFEQASLSTAAFVRDLAEQKLLTEGEFSIQPPGVPQPYLYRGFQMISEEALKSLRGDVARKWIQSGALGLVYAHLFSLNRMSDIFARQTAMGKTPPPAMSLNV
jgi:hypothetical protein